MKHQIGQAEYFELSQEARNKLDKWYVEHYFEEGRVFTDVYPYLTIGEMIEFLMEKESYYTGNGEEHWEGYAHNYISGEKFLIAVGKNKELCNLLWEAVKEVLENEI